MLLDNDNDRDLPIFQPRLKLSRSPMTSLTNSEITTYPSPMLVYDGSCGFCSRSVRFILRHEQRHDLSFVTRNSELGMELRREHGLESVESMLWIEGDQVFAESGAVMKAAGYLGGWWWRLATLGSFCPSFILNGVYKFIAKNRRRLSSIAAACLVPSQEQRKRFLA
jgi:predicted DCC family thiol-disulfide oxidoreductase YuxK